MIPAAQKTNEQIQALLARLAASEEQLAATAERLAEAEETLYAIHAGEIDGLVVKYPDGERVFTLEGTEHPYRVMIEAMEEGAATLSADGTVLYCNRRFATMLCTTYDQVLGAPITRFLAPESHAHFACLVTACRQDNVRDEVVFLALNGTRVPVSLACNVLPESGVEKCLCIVATDLTVYKAAEATIRQQNEELESRVEARTAELQYANAALRQSEEKYRAVFANSLFGILLGKPDGSILEANSAACRIFGMTEDELRCAGRAGVVDLPDPRLRRALQERACTGHAPLHEMTFIRKDGTRFEGEVTSSLFADGTGQQLVSTILSDITERKRAEKALRESEERYRLLADTMLQGVIHQDAEGRIISMNPAAERILGKSPEEFLGETSVSVEQHTIREDGRPFPGLQHPSMVALRTGHIVRNVVMGVYNPRLRDYRWINIDAIPLFRPGGTAPYQVYTVFEDITEGQQAEEALRASEQRYRSLFNGMTEGFALHEIICDDQGQPCDYRFLDINPAFERFTGLRREDVISR